VIRDVVIDDRKGSILARSFPAFPKYQSNAAARSDLSETIFRQITKVLGE